MCAKRKKKHFPGNVREASDLVAKTLGGDDGDILGDALVGREVEGEAGVVLLDDDTRSLRSQSGDVRREREVCVREAQPRVVVFLGFDS